MKPIYIILIIIVLAVLGVGVYVLQSQKKVYLEDSRYCKKDSDCVVQGNGCSAVNKYNFQSTSGPHCMIMSCGAICKNHQCELVTDLTKCYPGKE